jgi:tRNA(Glu) U13 pseudouridine synthase TruD
MVQHPPRRRGALRRVTAAGGGRISVLDVSRDRSKLRLGQLAAIASVSASSGARRARSRRASRRPRAPDALRVENRFGPQRFGAAGANVAIANAQRAATWRGRFLCVDASGTWQPGHDLPAASGGPTGRVIGALRRAPNDAATALGAAGPPSRLIASAAQSAVFNAVLDARSRAGWLYRLRAGDVARRRNEACSAAAEEIRH